jgi:hypothetical protein
MRALALVLLGGCSANAVHGRVDGFAVKIKSSFLAWDVPADGTPGTIVVAMSSLPNGCAVYQYWNVQMNKADSDPDALAQAWAQAFPEQFWEVFLTFRVDPGTWPAPGMAWQGNAWDQQLTTPSSAAMEFVQHNAHRPAEWFEGASGFEHDYFSNAGVVKFGRSIPNQRLSGRFSTLTVDETGLPTGSVNVDFAATPCPQLPPDAIVEQVLPGDTG